MRYKIIQEKVKKRFFLWQFPAQCQARGGQGEGDSIAPFEIAKQLKLIINWNKVV